VAERLQRSFVDLDREIESAAGMPIPEIFRREGEPAFRRHETEALRRALALEDVVIATGGGAACREDNLRAMLERARVVALSAPPAAVLERAGGRSGRPLLDGEDDPLSAAARLLREREPFYARAHVRVDTVGKTPEQVAEEVLRSCERGVEPT
jgi:shikimate kinase